MDNTLYKRHVIATADFSLDEINTVLTTAAQMKQSRHPNMLQGQILASCFFEASTRTRLSFESACLRLGGQVMGFADGAQTSIKKGESLSDSIRVIANYADAIVLRHPQEGAARLAAEVSTVPIINAGDGANRHPSQTLLDLFSIQEAQQRLTGLHIALVGDLKYARTAHSLALACARYDVRLYFVSPESLTMPDHICNRLRSAGVKYSFHRGIDDVVNKVDILYLTRLQRERLHEQDDISALKHCLLKPEMLQQAKPNLKILHALPRTAELPSSIDNSDFAYYFQQAENGLYVRQALLALLLNKSL